MQTQTSKTAKTFPPRKGGIRLAATSTHVDPTRGVTLAGPASLRTASDTPPTVAEEFPRPFHRNMVPASIPGVKAALRKALDETPAPEVVASAADVAAVALADSLALVPAAASKKPAKAPKATKAPKKPKDARSAPAGTSEPSTAKTAPAGKSEPKKAGSKLAMISAMLQRPEGATAKEILEATDWPAVSVPQQARAAKLTLRMEGRPARYYGTPI